MVVLRKSCRRLIFLVISRNGSINDPNSVDISVSRSIPPKSSRIEHLTDNLGEVEYNGQYNGGSHGFLTIVPSGIASFPQHKAELVKFGQ
jgi:hypothetical protein